ncbi:MAG TPA: sulfur carrier protein ThiS [Myxococcota bacterium]|nr:sulfur carrier protein ThiS [Myxococcota bacterium]
MQYVLNGEAQTAGAPLSVLDLLTRFELSKRRVAVAINAEVVPKSRFAEVWIRDGDRVEVIHAVGGGA